MMNHHSITVPPDSQAHSQRAASRYGLELATATALVGHSSRSGSPGSTGSFSHRDRTSPSTIQGAIESSAVTEAGLLALESGAR